MRKNLTPKKELNLGGGQTKIPGSANIDLIKTSAVDIQHDLNHTPYPLKTNQFTKIYCYDILEHLHNVIKVMEELHRIGRPNAKIIIRSPHFSHMNAYTDITHVHHFGFFSFDYFTDNNKWNFYTKKSVRFSYISRRIVFQNGLLKKLFEWFFNRHPKYYESKLAWIFPAQQIDVVLQVIKN